MKAVSAPEKWQLRLFAGSWAMLVLLAAWLIGVLPPAAPAGILLVGIACCFCSGLFVPALMAGPYRLAECLLSPVGHLFSLLMLAVVYFTLFTLFAVVLRLLSWDPLRLRREHWPASGWMARDKDAGDSDYRWQY